MDPINYVQQVQTPFQNSLVGVQAGLAIGATAEQNQAKQLQLQQAQQAQQAQLEMQRDLAALSQKRDATANDYAQVMTKWPQLSDHLSKSLAAHTDAQRENVVSDAGQVFAALRAGKPDIARQVLSEKAAAYRNSGDEHRAVGLDAVAKSIELHPESAQTSVGLLLGQAMGPEKFGAMISSIGKDARDVELFPAAKSEAESKAKSAGSEAVIKSQEAANIGKKLGLENTNTQSQIIERAARLKLEKDRLVFDKDKAESELQQKMQEFAQKSGELPEHVYKGIETASTNAIAARHSADRMDSIIKRFESMGLSEIATGGFPAVAAEFLKRGLGTQGELTAIRREIDSEIVPAAMAAYRKVATGSTSDKDISTALTGSASSIDDPKVLMSYMRGRVKAQRIEDSIENAKAEWLGAVKNLNAAKTDLTIDGVAVPRGMTFSNFIDAYLPKKLEFVRAMKQGAAPTAPEDRSYWAAIK
jgi:hypothetical protein